MSEYRVLIMAGGTLRDWAPMGRRQLLSVHNETLIDRIIRQSRQVFQTEPIIITDDYKKPFGFDYQYIYPECSNPVEAFAGSENYWGDTTVILQGDVFYPDVPSGGR